ncbi:flagellar biosynthesis anti-sigma factor FlgM [Sphingopyxis sp. JAI128]|uniref:flagellar biosynthesis anti-sigma factor FlgM n=1 Tax=Sphingopyxis sp. JAI128 TaxID=2723066 RepID=UPI00161A0020|nr:flagellar biosynthesis anti-sigma factor FlgM [Sphingopyxis sp. JAI128]MBB6426315.1 negative regulator of flagellin synthesis FlgM [Sphingopyxis sp. JAI128]
MSGDSKIGPIGGIVRANPLRGAAGSPAARAAAPVHTAQDSVPAARLTRLTGSLASEPPPIDVARVASLRSAIASGNYSVHPAIIASAMLDFHGRGAE